MTKEIRRPNDEGRASDQAGRLWTFELRHSFDIRHSDFVIGLAFLSRLRAAKLDPIQALRCE